MSSLPFMAEQGFAPFAAEPAHLSGAAATGFVPTSPAGMRKAAPSFTSGRFHSAGMGAGLGAGMTDADANFRMGASASEAPAHGLLPTTPSRGMTALLARETSPQFARNPAYSGHAIAAQDAAPPSDPLQDAYDRGYAEALHAATAQAQAQEAERRQMDQQIALRFAQWDDETAKAMRERLRLTVIALCEETVLPLALDMDGLLARIQRAVDMLQRATDERRVLLNPADFERICHRLPEGLSAQPHPSVEPGGLRIETPDGGVEDGPSQWRQALAEAFQEC